MTQSAYLRLAEINDEFRRRGFGEDIHIDDSIRAQGDCFVSQVLSSVRAYDHFQQSSNSLGCHDYGFVMISGQYICWRISYLNKDGSPSTHNPSDPVYTTRLLNIFLIEQCLVA